MHKLFKSPVLRALPPLLVAVHLAVSILPNSPLVGPYDIPQDSGVFMYAGWRLLEGDVPYRDFWDHKPPGIFVINALALFFGGVNRWGVWACELLFIESALLLAWKTCRQRWGYIASVVSLAGWTGLVMPLGGGLNLTEFYALPMQFGILALITTPMSKADRFDRSISWVGVGLLGGLLFLLRQNLIAIPIAVGISFLSVSVFQKRRNALRRFLFLAAGAAIPLLTCMLYFITHGAFAEFLDAFMYNFSYCGERNLFGYANSMLGSIDRLRGSGLAVFGFAGWLVMLIIAGTSFWQRSDTEDLLPLVLLFAVPLELACAAASGRDYVHYTAALLPVFSVLTAYSVASLLQLSYNVSGGATQKRHTTIVPTLILSLFACAFLVPTARSLQQIVQALSDQQDNTHDDKHLVQWIQSHSCPNDTVLFWGAKPGYNFLARRSAPVKYMYIFPLMKPYAPPERIEDFIGEIKAHPPQFIFDAFSHKPKLSLDNNLQTLSERMEKKHFGGFFDFVRKHYVQIPASEDLKLPAYRLSRNGAGKAASRND